MRSRPRRSSVPVSRKKRIHQFHSFHHVSDRTKSLVVQKGIAFMTGIDKNLRSSRMGRSSRGKGHGTALIADSVTSLGCLVDTTTTTTSGRQGVVRNGTTAPVSLHVRIGRNPKLSKDSREDPKNPTLIPKLRFRKFLSTGE